jgi:hypothetical protein
MKATHAQQEKYQKRPPWGLGGSKICFSSNLIFLVTQNSMQNFITLEQPLPGEKYVAEKENKERQMIPNIVFIMLIFSGYT